MIEQNLRPEIADRISSFAGKNARGAAARRKIGVKCPVCGGEIVTTPFGYGCANYKNDKSGCNFNIGQVAGLDIPEEQVKKLIEEGITDTIRGFKSKSGKRFDACLKLNKDEQTNKVSATFDFENVKPQRSRALYARTVEAIYMCRHTATDVQTITDRQRMAAISSLEG